MAETLTRQRSNRRSRRAKAFDPRERELKRLKLSVCDDVGFRLYLATYDQPKRRDELIARVVTEAEVEKVRVTRLDLAKAGPETNLVGLLRAHLAGTDLPPSWRQAVMVTGIEQRLDYSAGSEGFAFLHQANLLRDALPEAAPVSVVLWLSRMASASLPAEAPDLWHWRAANFDFTGDEAPRLELLRELRTLRPENEDGLSGEQRQARIQMLEALLAELEREGPPHSKRQSAERANLLLESGNEDLRMRRAAGALPSFERALAVYRELGFRPGEAMALRLLGSAWQQLGESYRAVEHYEQALAITREIGDRRGEGDVLGNLAAAYAGRGETRRAIEHHEQTLTIARDAGDRRIEGGALLNLGAAWAGLGETRRGIEYLERSLENLREIGDRRGERVALATLGNIYAHLADNRRAIEHFEQSLAIARETGDRLGEGFALATLGSHFLSLGETRRAIKYCEQALVLTRGIGDRSEGIALATMGGLYMNLGEAPRAIEFYEQALTIFHEIGDRRGEHVVHQGLGLTYAAVGEPRRAIEHYKQELAITREIGDRWNEGNSLYNGAVALDQLGERRKAITRMEEALRIFEQIGSERRKDAEAKLVAWEAEEGDG